MSALAMPASAGSASVTIAFPGTLSERKRVRWGISGLRWLGDPVTGGSVPPRAHAQVSGTVTGGQSVIGPLQFAATEGNQELDPEDYPMPLEWDGNVTFTATGLGNAADNSCHLQVRWKAL